MKRRMHFMGNSFVGSQVLIAQRQQMGCWFSEDLSDSPIGVPDSKPAEAPKAPFVPKTRRDRIVDAILYAGVALYSVAVALQAFGLLHR